MNAATKKTTIGILTELRDTKITGSGVKRSLTATIKKVEAGAIIDMHGVAAALNAAADKPLTIPQDAETLRSVALVASAPAEKPRTASKAVAKAVKQTPAERVRAAAAKPETVTKPVEKVVKRSTAGKAAKDTSDTVTAYVGTIGGKKLTAKYSKSEAVGIYKPVFDVLASNGLEPVLNYGPDGVAIHFTALAGDNSWDYQVWAPKWNVSGEDEGWVIGFTPDAGSVDPEYVDTTLTTPDDVLSWLIDDLQLDRAAYELHKAAQPTRTVAVAQNKAVASVVNASRVLMEQARNVAENLGTQNADTMALFQTIIEAQASLRQLLDGEK